MSRSYRKGFQIAGVKDFKKIYNRKLRRSQLKNEDVLPQGSDYKKMNEPWEIADYRGSISWEDAQSWGYTWEEYQKLRSK